MNALIRVGRTDALRVGCVLALSLAVKLAAVGYMNRHLSWNLVAPDTRGSYSPLAKSLLRGEGYQIDGDAREATRIAPLFPAYLALLYGLWGTDAPVWVIGAANAVCRAGVTLFVYLLAARAFGRRASLVAATLHAIDPWEGFWAAFVLKESIAVLLFVAAVWSVMKMLDAGSLRWAAAAGAAIAIASLTRYASLGFYPWMLLTLATMAMTRRLQTTAALRLAVALSLGLMATLGPWVARNYRLFGEPVMARNFAGLSFYASNGPGAERTPDTSGYSGMTVPDQQPIREVRLAHRSVNEQEWELFLRAARHLAGHPWIVPRLLAARLVNMWRPTFQGASTANLLVLGLPYCVIFLLGVAGLVVARRTIAPAPGMAPAVLLYSVVLFFVALHAVFWSEIRYRQYAMPFLDVFAGLAVTGVLRRLRPVAPDGA